MEQKNARPDDTVAAEVCPEELEGEITEPLFLTHWYHHAAVWKGKKITVMVDDSHLPDRPDTQISTHYRLLLTLELAQECWLNFGQFICIISWYMELIFASIVFVCCSMESQGNRCLRDLFAMGKRLTEIIEHYCRGSVWLKPLICTINYIGGTEGTPQIDKEE